VKAVHEDVDCDSSQPPNRERQWVDPVKNPVSHSGTPGVDIGQRRRPNHASVAEGENLPPRRVFRAEVGDRMRAGLSRRRCPEPSASKSWTEPILPLETISRSRAEWHSCQQLDPSAVQWRLPLAG
jgi:hypothetical protein